MDINEFILFSLLFDEYKEIKDDDFNLKNIFYLCLFSKKKLDKKFSDIFEKYKKDNKDFCEWDDKNKKQFEIPIYKFNKRYRELFYKNNILNRPRVTDYDKLIDYICDKKGRRKDKKKINSKKNNDIQLSDSLNLDNSIKIDISQKEETQKSGVLDINTNNNIKVEEDKYIFNNNINAFFLKDSINNSKKSDIQPLNDDDKNMKYFDFDSFSIHSYLFGMEDNLFEDKMDYLFDKYYTDFFGYENGEKDFPSELKPNLGNDILDKLLN